MYRDAIEHTHRYLVIIACVLLAACSGDNGSSATNQAPTASFSLTQISALNTLPAKYSFDGTTSSDKDGSVASYFWDFGDNSSARGRTTSHSYTAIGTYVVTLTITDNTGATAQTNQSITVVKNRPPFASFTATPLRGTVAPHVVDLDASASTDDSAVQSYVWDFGDGSILTIGKTVNHVYQNYGSYTVSLTVADDTGKEDSTTQQITVGYSLSGTIAATVGSSVDSDVNDPLAPYAANDTPLTAQQVENPMVIAGFATAVGTGISDDRFEISADAKDMYRVTLGANQVIQLFGSQIDLANDLDLFLYTLDNTVTPVASSLNSGSSESLLVPANGIYYVMVMAVRGTSGYVLTIGDTSALTSALTLSNTLRIENEFMPGEVIVKFKNELTSSSNMALSTLPSMQNRASSIGMIAKLGHPARHMLFSLGSEKEKQHAFSVLGVSNASVNNLALKLGDTKQQYKYDTIQAVKALRQRPDVLSADLNYIRHSLALPNDAGYTKQWHYPFINLPAAWDTVIADNAANPNALPNIIVAVVDTGVFLNHTDLNDNLVAGYDFISSIENAGDGDGRDTNPNDTGDKSRSDGTSSFHGTHVSGTIAAESNNNATVPGGVAGVAWNTNTRIMPIRALGTLGGSSFDIMEGIRYAVGLSNTEESQAATDARIASGIVADIINLSIGGPSSSNFEQAIFNEVRNAGVIVIAAAGNEGSSVPSYPASYTGVVSVSAVDKLKEIASYSNFGQSVDITAPGGGVQAVVDRVYSTIANDGVTPTAIDYNYLSGTSMATPHVAGVAALMKSVYPQLTPDEFDVLLQSGNLTDDLSADGVNVRNDKFGYGLINASKAILQTIALRDSGNLPPVFSLSTQSFMFLQPDSVATLTITNMGGGTITLNTVTNNAPWLTITPNSVDANNLGTYSIIVNRTGLANTQYQATITLNYSGDLSGSATVPVTMQVGPLSTAGNTGYLHGRVIDYDAMISGAIDPVIRREIIGSPLGSLYNYSFSGIGPGNYLVVSTSGFNNNIIVCDAAEACGIFPFVITITNEDIEGLNFNSKIKINPGFFATHFKNNSVK